MLANRAELDPRVRFVADTPPDPESLIVVPLDRARPARRARSTSTASGYQEFTEDEFLLVVRFGDAAALAIDNAHIRATLEHQAQTDPLTGLWNHRAFHERLRQELVDASTDQTPVALVMLDLDDFKRVNDVYSHATGDHVLVRGRDDPARGGALERHACAGSAARSSRSSPRASGLADAFRLAERVQEHVAATDVRPGRPGDRLDRRSRRGRRTQRTRASSSRAPRWR